MQSLTLVSRFLTKMVGNDNNCFPVYIAVEKGASPSPVALSVVTTGEPFQRTWKIRITQIPCSSEVKGNLRRANRTFF